MEKNIFTMNNKINSLDVRWSIGFCQNCNGIYHDEHGNKYIFKDGFLNSELNEPSFVNFKGDLMWHKQGKLHNEDGPATIMGNGEKVFYIENKKLNESDFIKWQIENNKHCLQKKFNPVENKTKIKI